MYMDVEQSFLSFATERLTMRLQRGKFNHNTPCVLRQREME